MSNTLQNSLSSRSGLLRFATAGNVDDGKSTLIGRLLYDSKSLLADQVTAMEAASRKRGLTEPDLSLLTDGLIAEREQGITIDVAYRYFATPARKFIIADSPGHAQYTRNMVTAASTADVAVLLVDARNGLQSQTRRHAALAHWVGIRRVVLAVNKMDLVDYSQQRFDQIVAAFTHFSKTLDFTEAHAIPLSALRGDMVVERGTTMSWYHGPTLLEYLERVPSRRDDPDRALSRPLRLPVQRVVRVPRGQAAPTSGFGEREFRGYQGTIASGSIALGDTVVALPSGLTAVVTELFVADQAAQRADTDQAITMTLDRDLDISRGDLFVSEHNQPTLQRDARAELCWFDAESLDVMRNYLIKQGCQTVRARFTALHDRLDVESLSRSEAPPTLAMNDIGLVTIRANKLLPFERYREQRATGAFIVVDELSNRTVAAGTVV